MALSKYVVVRIVSRKSLEYLTNFISTEFGGDVPFMRVVFNRDGETNMTIAIVEHAVLHRMLEVGLGSRPQDRTTGHSDAPLTIAKYELRDHEFPKEDQSSNLYIPIPKSLVDRSESSVQGTINAKIEALSACGLLTSGTWTVKVLLESRQRGVVGRGCYVSFDASVKDADRAFVRLCLNDTYWGEVSEAEEDQDQVFRCVWARKPVERKPRAETDTQEAPVSEEEQREKRKIARINRFASKAVPVNQPPPRRR